MSPLLRSASLCVLVLLGALASGQACSIPVFTYALANWTPDDYHAVIVPDGALSPHELALVERLRLRTAEKAETGAIANLSVDVVGPEHRASLPTPVLEALAATSAGSQAARNRPPGARLILTYPSILDGAVCIDEPLSEALVESLLDSPVRRRAAAHLMSGGSGALILLSCGDAAADAAASATVAEAVAIMHRNLTLPSPHPENDRYLKGRPMPAARVEFQVITLRRDDPAERLTVALLDRFDASFTSIQGPKAFMVFGRGRFLPISGSEFDLDILPQAGRFVTAACSCQVKEQNPGIDLLMTADWPSYAVAPPQDAAASESEPLMTPPEAPVQALASPQAHAAPSAVASPTAFASATTAAQMGSVARSSLLAVLPLLALIALGLLLWARSGQR